MDLGEVQAIAARLRRAMKAAHEAGELAFFATETFPGGYCCVAADFVCQYMRDAGIGGAWHRVSGDCPRRGTESGPLQTHAWAECEGVIVDVTADQFPGRSPLFVGPEDAWYRAITRTGSEVGGISGYLDAEDAREAYEAVRQRASGA
ncbi:hypothetical protein ACTVZO_41205 [Streptomyces sp. IBSNAI002]|uniref:hypothetical protein n=1 Tax=Streptomyces sp. IBSNAI002 TaxID=3457500 RepID=UPI003FD58A1B